MSRPGCSRLRKLKDRQSLSRRLRRKERSVKRDRDIEVQARQRERDELRAKNELYGQQPSYRPRWWPSNWRAVPSNLGR